MIENRVYFPTVCMSSNTQYMFNRTDIRGEPHQTVESLSINHLYIEYSFIPTVPLYVWCLNISVRFDLIILKHNFNIKHTWDWLRSHLWYVHHTLSVLWTGSIRYKNTLQLAINNYKQIQNSTNWIVLTYKVKYKPFSGFI